MKVLVTGASGFLGPHVSTALQKSGCRVRAAIRTPDRPAVADEHIVVPTSGELADWTDSVKGIDAVVHLAARAHRSPAAQLSEQDIYERVNVTNTVNLARAAATAGARHFIYLSSIAVNGLTTDGRAPFREDDTPAPSTVYARTKLAAETKLGEIAADTGMRLTMVRTPLIYGRGAKGSLALLARALQRGLPLPLAGVKNRRAFVAAENVASFVLHRLQQGNDSGAFIVADDEQISTPEFVRLLAQGLGIRPHLFVVPEKLLTGLLHIAGRDHTAESLLTSLEVDTSKARATGWRPAVTQREALGTIQKI